MKVRVQTTCGEWWPLKIGKGVTKEDFFRIWEKTTMGALFESIDGESYIQKQHIVAITIN